MAIQLLSDSKDFMKFMIQPHSSGCTRKQVEMVAKNLPDLPVISLRLWSICSGDAQRIQGNAVGVEHPKDIVIRNKDQFGWIRKRFIVREYPRIHMTVRTNDGEILHALVQLHRDLAYSRVGIEETVFIEF